MRVLFAASECYPYAKTGGLGDVVSALPTSLYQIDCNIRIIIPFYQQVSNYFKENKEKKISQKYNLEVSFSSVSGLEKKYDFNVLESTLPNSEMIIYFIDIPEFFDRTTIYVNEKGKGYSDSAEIYAYFCKAILKLVLELDKVDDWYPDLIHANDWHTGFLSFLIKNKLVKLPKPIKTIFTIHNMAYQGNFSINKLNKFGITKKMPLYNDLVHKYKSDSVNYLKAGIICSDFVTTVSKRYRDELLTPEYGYGLEIYLQSRLHEFVGILNGVDYKLWDPKLDDLIVENYSSNDLYGKQRCKAVLLDRYNVKGKNAPIFGMVSRLDSQKGISILIEVLKNLDPENLKEFHIIIIGTGYNKYEEALLDLSKKLSFLTVICAFNNKLAHEIEAGSDFFLMPSKYEPCGLNQMYSLKYGTIPIVRNTGGLADTVTDITEKDNIFLGNGFVFNAYSGDEFKKSILKAMDFYYKFKETDKYRTLLLNIMNLDYSWQKSAQEYIKFYSKLNSKSEKVQ